MALTKKGRIFRIGGIGLSEAVIERLWNVDPRNNFEGTTKISQFFSS